MNLAVISTFVRSGKTITTRVSGNSMEPRIKSGSKVTIAPTWEPPEIGDVVLCRVNGKYYLHLVSAIHAGRYQISNNKGHVNGWASEIVGVVVEDETPAPR